MVDTKICKISRTNVLLVCEDCEKVWVQTYSCIYRQWLLKPLFSNHHREEMVNSGLSNAKYIQMIHTYAQSEAEPVRRAVGRRRSSY